ncbi:corepressor interacting with RBPJ 1-like [Haliotis rubra]|uniref:corepressor interacting with RBPJ 1-like n=1 Tax=Haliotis rubra TaxID=36100 RepID=UPI001EE5D3DB|nr:corepressor interacting with RBPJ 1-like [Haliotis rubra]
MADLADVKPKRKAAGARMPEIIEALLKQSPKTPSSSLPHPSSPSVSMTVAGREPNMKSEDLEKECDVLETELRRLQLQTKRNKLRAEIGALERNLPDSHRGGSVQQRGHVEQHGGHIDVGQPEVATAGAHIGNSQGPYARWILAADYLTSNLSHGHVVTAATLDEAVQLAVELEALQHAEIQRQGGRKLARVIEDTRNEDLRSQVSDLTKAVANLTQRVTQESEDEGKRTRSSSSSSSSSTSSSSSSSSSSSGNFKKQKKENEEEKEERGANKRRVEEEEAKEDRKIRAEIEGQEGERRAERRRKSRGRRMKRSRGRRKRRKQERQREKEKEE